MNKMLKKTFVISLLLFFSTIFTCVYAGTAYVDDMQVDCKVQQNGNMDVTETITFNVDGNLNGLYRDIKITGNGNTKGASNVKVTDVKVDGMPMKYSSATLYNGANGKYNLLEISGGKQVRIYTPTNNTRKIVKITYTLYDVITVYDDVAELYWNFIGTEWSYGIDNVEITVNIPGDAGVAGEDLRVWSHGPLNGNSEIVDSSTLKFSVSNLASNTAFDGRTTFPKSLVPNAKNVVNEIKLPSIIDEETKLADQANADREFNKIIIYAIGAVLAVAVLLPIVLYIKWKKNIYKAKFDGEYYRELPEDYGPAVMNACLSRGNLGIYKKLNMQSTLMDLVRRKYIKIEEYTIEKLLKDKKDYKLTLINKNFTDLNEHEKRFINSLIFINGDEITLDELSKINNKGYSVREEMYKNYQKWEQSIEKVGVDKGILKGKSDKKKPRFVTVLYIMITVIFISMFILSVYQGSYVLIAFALMAEYSIISVSVIKYCALTEKGEEHLAMWKAFKKFLLDFSNMQDYDEKSLILWEHFLVYATGLGVAEKVIKNLKIKFPEMQDVNNLNNMAVLSMCSNSDAFDSFNSAFGSVTSSAFSSPSSGSGGGGGSSGGGGGGRRWRRRRRLLKKINML